MAYEDLKDLSRGTTSDKVLHALSEKCPYSEFYWSVFSHIWTEYRDISILLSIFSPNAGKYGSENLRIRTLFTQ